MALVGGAVAQAPKEAPGAPFDLGMLGSVELAASASADQVRVEWRPLGPGAGGALVDPRFGLGGISARQRTLAFDEPVHLVFAIGGSEAEIARQIALAEAISEIGLARGAEIVLARLSPEFEVLAQVATTDALRAALNAVRTALPASADTPRTLPNAFEYALGLPGRTALIVGAEAFPRDEDILIAIASAAIAREVYLFPVTSDEMPVALPPFVEVTGGRVMAGAGDGDPAAALADLLGGARIVFDLPAHRTYRLPGETAAPLALTVDVDPLSDVFELEHATPILSWTQIAWKGLQPQHWGAWLSQTGRRPFGLVAGLVNLALLGLAVLGARRLIQPRPAGPYAPEPVPTDDAEHPAIALTPVAMSIGRKPECDYVLSDPSVSRLHAYLVREKDTLRVKDENSTYGLFILRQGAWTQIDESPVEIGDQLKFGDYIVSVEELVSAIDLQAADARGTEAEPGGLQRFRKPRRNPYTGRIEEGS